MTRPLLLIATALALLAAAVAVGVGRAQAPVAPVARPPPPVPRGLNLVVVIDREMSADRVALALMAAREILAALGPEDRLGFIAVGEDLLTQSGSDEVPRGREMLSRWLDGVLPSTATGDIGLGPPLQMADGLLFMTRSGSRAPRVVLLSDGAHVPGILSNAEQRALVLSLAHRGVRVDALSPGTPEVRPPLEALAELGNGRLVVLHVAADVRQLLDRAP